MEYFNEIAIMLNGYLFNDVIDYVIMGYLYPVERKKMNKYLKLNSLIKGVDYLNDEVYMFEFSNFDILIHIGLGLSNKERPLKELGCDFNESSTNEKLVRILRTMDPRKRYYDNGCWELMGCHIFGDDYITYKDDYICKNCDKKVKNYYGKILCWDCKRSFVKSMMINVIESIGKSTMYGGKILSKKLLEAYDIKEILY